MKIIEKSSQLNSLCSKKDFHLFSSNGLTNSSLNLLRLPLNMSHDIQLARSCLKKHFIYSSYLIQMNSIRFHEQFLDETCVDNQSKFSFSIKENSLPIGLYLYHLTITNVQTNEIEHFIQPIEIFELNTTNNKIPMKSEEKYNYTLFCYPEGSGKDLFIPNGLQIGEYHRWNKRIVWEEFQLVDHRPQLNYQFNENECLSSKNDFHSFLVDAQTRQMFINQNLFNVKNRTLYFDLIQLDLINGNVRITRTILNAQNEENLIGLENVLDRFDYFVLEKDPNESIQVIDELAQRFNQINQSPVRSISSPFLNHLLFSQ